MVRSHETGVVASGPSSVIPWRSSSSRCFCLSLPKMDTLATTSASSRFFITFQRPLKMAGALITMSVVMNSGYVSANVAKYVRYLKGEGGASEACEPRICARWRRIARGGIHRLSISPPVCCIPKPARSTIWTTLYTLRPPLCESARQYVRAASFE